MNRSTGPRAGKNSQQFLPPARHWPGPHGPPSQVEHDPGPPNVPKSPPSTRLARASNGIDWPPPAIGPAMDGGGTTTGTGCAPGAASGIAGRGGAAGTFGSVAGASTNGGSVSGVGAGVGGPSESRIGGSAVPAGAVG